MITAANAGDLGRPLRDDAGEVPTTVAPLDTLRSAAEVMAESKLTSFPVVERGTNLFVGILTVEDMLLARGKASQRNSDRRRVLSLQWPFGRSGAGAEETEESEAREQTGA